MRGFGSTCWQRTLPKSSVAATAAAGRRKPAWQFSSVPGLSGGQPNVWQHNKWAFTKNPMAKELLCDMARYTLGFSPVGPGIQLRKSIAFDDDCRKGQRRLSSMPPQLRRPPSSLRIINEVRQNATA